MAFEVKLKGESVQGEGGPYRAFFADVSSELQPRQLSSHQRNLNLMIPSVNNQRKEGESRDKYVLNPSANSSYQLKLYEYLGMLMASCVRTGAHLTLDLPMHFWKCVSLHPRPPLAGSLTSTTRIVINSRYTDYLLSYYPI